MKQNQLITLNFRIRKDLLAIENVNLNQPLKVSVQKALEQHGGTSEKWVVMKGDNQLDISKKVKDLGLVNGDLLKIILGGGGGG